MTRGGDRLALWLLPAVCVAGLDASMVRPWGWASLPEPGSVLGGAVGAAHEAGAPPGRAGAPGESSCYECHNDLELNEPLGRLRIVGLPPAWEPGESYLLTVLLESEGMVRAGFQATATGGSLHPVDGRVASVSDSLGRSYVGHAPGRTIPDSEERTVWSVEWVAPALGADILRLYVAANSANGDNSPLGDFVYTTSADVPAASPEG